MAANVCIPDAEYGQRVEQAAKLIADEGLDLFIANGNEADYANCRYFSGYWPLFEIGGVAIAPSGKAALMIGPESGTYARDRSKIPNIHKLVEYRESADPAYPGVEVSRFTDALRSRCRDMRMDYEVVDTADPLDAVLTSYLATRNATVR